MGTSVPPSSCTLDSSPPPLLLYSRQGSATCAATHLIPPPCVEDNRDGNEYWTMAMRRTWASSMQLPAVLMLLLKEPACSMAGRSSMLLLPTLPPVRLPAASCSTSCRPARCCGRSPGCERLYNMLNCVCVAEQPMHGAAGQVKDSWEEGSRTLRGCCGPGWVWQ